MPGNISGMDTTKLERQKINIFSEVTTYNADYVKPSHMCRVEPSNKPQAYKKRVEGPPKKQQEFKDIETYFNFDPNHYVPFDMLWKPKPIVGTLPTQTFVNPVISKATVKKWAMSAEKGNKPMDPIILSRPRVVLEPGISMDDLDPAIRAEVCDSVYRSMWNARGELPPTEDERYRCLQYRKERLNSTLECPSGDQTRVKERITVPLQLGWHRFAINWDALQTRAAVDPTKTFWINKDPPVQCGACTDRWATDPEKSKEIDDLVKANKIRIAHDLLGPGYLGYQPRIATGVELKKTEHQLHERFVTTAEAMNRDIEDDWKQRRIDMNDIICSKL